MRAGFFSRLCVGTAVLLFIGSVLPRALSADPAPVPPLGGPKATQVPAGSTTAIGPVVKPPAPATTDTPQGKMLNSALSTDTRKTLQQAMDQNPTPASGK